MDFDPWFTPPFTVLPRFTFSSWRGVIWTEGGPINCGAWTRAIAFLLKGSTQTAQTHTKNINFINHHGQILGISPDCGNTTEFQEIPGALARSRYEVVKSHWSTGHLHGSTWRQQVEQCGWVCPELSVAGSVFSIDQTVGEMGSTIWRDSITQTRTKPPWMICHGKWIADLHSARNTRSGAPLPSWAGNGFARNFGGPPKSNGRHFWGHHIFRCRLGYPPKNTQSPRMFIQ